MCELIDYVAVEDVGRIINPLTLHGQAIGAVVQGLGGALLEHFVYDEHGQLLTGSLADYLLPTASDFPSIRAVALEEKPAPHNPLGAKGAGEGGIIPVGGVIANAVAAALASLGVEPRELPLSPPRVWELIKAAKASAESASKGPHVEQSVGTVGAPLWRARATLALSVTIKSSTNHTSTARTSRRPAAAAPTNSARANSAPASPGRAGSAPRRSSRNPRP